MPWPLDKRRGSHRQVTHSRQSGSKTSGTSSDEYIVAELCYVLMRSPLRPLDVPHPVSNADVCTQLEAPTLRSVLNLNDQAARKPRAGNDREEGTGRHPPRQLYRPRPKAIQKVPCR